MKLLRNTLAGLSALSVLAACTPTFQTTEQLCQAHLPTRQIVQNQSYEVLANEENSEYKLYLEDFINSFKGLQSKSIDASGNPILSDLSADEEAVRDFILQQISADMNYTLDDEGTVESANNPLDFMENLIAAIDSEKLVQTFVEAKEQMSSAISSDDGHCTYSNDQIEFLREDDSFNILDQFSASLDLTYIPSAFVEIDNKVDQTVLIAFDQDPTVETDDEIQFAALDRIAPENFKESGFSEAKVRQIKVIHQEPPQILTVDEDYLESKYGTLGYALLNQTCLDDDEENVVTCPDGSITKEIEHPACFDLIDDDGDSLTEHDEADERNTVISNSFTIGDGSNDALTDLQRLKVEVDYPNEEIRVYVSKFSTAIYKALEDDRETEIPQGDDNPNPTREQLIYNPTSCESYNVSKDLFELQSEEDQENNVAVPANSYEDPGYEYIAQTDEDGEPLLDEDDNVIYTSPTPLFIFQGTAIPERQ